MDGIDDAADYKEVMDAFDKLKFDAQTRKDVFRTTAGVLHLGNVSFDSEGQVGAIIIILWVVTLSSVMFVTLKLLGIFRVPLYQEEVGADISKHGGSAYESSKA